MNYREYVQLLSRMNAEDFQDQGSQVHLAAIGNSADELVVRATTAMLSRLLLLAGEDTLEVIGRERGLTRYPGEYLQAFRNRLLKAWEFWDQAGTIPGMLTALEHMGYGVRIGMLNGDTAEGIFPAVSGGVSLTQFSGGEVIPTTHTFEVDGQSFVLDTLTVPGDYSYYQYPPTKIVEHFHEDQTIWAEFSIYLTPTEASFNADAWDDGARWDDETLWDLTISQAEVDRIRAVIGEIKPAHARLRAIYLVSRFRTDFWDDGSLWDDQTVWDADQPTLLYLRPGA